METEPSRQQRARLSEQQKRILRIAFDNIQASPNHRGMRLIVCLDEKDSNDLIEFCQRARHVNLGRYESSSRWHYVSLLKNQSWQMKELAKAKLLWEGMQSALALRLNKVPGVDVLSSRDPVKLVSTLPRDSSTIIVGAFKHQAQADTLKKCLRGATVREEKPYEPDATFEECLEMLGCDEHSLCRSITRLVERGLVQRHDLARGIVLTPSGYDLAQQLTTGEPPPCTNPRRKLRGDPPDAPRVHTIHTQAKS